MTELSIAYTFTAPDGAKFVLGASAAAVADPDWVGYLDPQQAFTGLLDGPEQTSNVAKRPAADGILVGPTFLGERSGTVQGVVAPAAALAVIEANAAKIRRVLDRCRNADGLLTYTPSYDGIGRQLRFRRAGKPDIRGRQPTTFLLPLLSRDPVILGQTLKASAAYAMSGLSNVNKSLTNAGDADAWPSQIEITGPLPAITNIQNFTDASKFIRIDYALPAGRKLWLYPERGIMLEDIAGVLSDKSGALTWTTGGQWWKLKPGANSVSVILSANGSAATTVTIRWRDAWP